ncbi:MAG: glycosyltransferase family 2 protein [Breznakia sp.]
MQFKIIECRMYGIRNPLLYLNGWIENGAKYIEVRDQEQVYVRQALSQYATKICFFNLHSAISSSTLCNVFSVIAIDESGNEQVLTSFKSTPLLRLKERYKSLNYRQFVKTYYKEYTPLLKRSYNMHKEKEYHAWIKKSESSHSVQEYAYQPKLSVIIPVYNVSRRYLSACLDSILCQSYQNFEVCLADDCSNKQETISTLKAYENKDERIKVVYRKENGHISLASNSALAIASGEFVVMMDNDDVIVQDAFHEIICALNKDVTLDFVYSDEDKIDEEGNRSDPQFKPDLAMDKLYGGNYICHLNVVRRSILHEIGGFRQGFEGAQDFDLFLRVLLKTDRFYHIPKILYHWRMIEGSTALNPSSKNYAGEAGKRALESYFTQKKVDVQVSILLHTHYFIEYKVKKNPCVHILMEVHDIDFFDVNRIQKMLDSLAYQNCHISFISEDKNLSDKLRMATFAHEVVVRSNVIGESFYQVVQESDSEYLLFMNEYVTLESFDAVDVLLGYSAQAEHGVVSGKLSDYQQYVIDAGYFLVNNKLLPTHIASFPNDFGEYGTLLVANNYRIVSPSFFMVSKTNFMRVQGFNDAFARDMFHDFHLRLSECGLRNVCVPHVEARADQKYEKYKVEKTSIKRWQEENIDCMYDKYYNENLSKDFAFRLPKKN